MGLNFEPGTAAWSCGGFLDFRRRLAKQIGMVLDFMPGFRREKHELFGLDIEPKLLAKLADNLQWPNDPICILLRHSDCEGEMSPGECLSCGPRLYELIAKWPSDSYDTKMADELAFTMQYCAENDKPLKFR